MAGMGPPPKDASKRARRNATIAFTQLPADGRKGPAPKWPLRPDGSLTRAKIEAETRVDRLRQQMNATNDRRKLGRLERELDGALADADVLEQQLAEAADRELELWNEMWSTPQATVWERDRCERQVAVYVRCQLRADDGDLKATTEARLRADGLGLTPKGLMQLRWAVPADEVAARRQEKAAAAPKKATGARARRGALTVVKDPKAPKAAAGHG